MNLPLSNFINLDESLLDKPVYRVMSIQRVLQALEQEHLMLVKPKKWDDPFENALLESQFESSDGETFTLAAKDSVYGQCWTLHRETDAMWRIYSANKDGVRISSTPRKLLTALAHTCGQLADIRCFMGRVKYLTKSNLLNKLSSIDLARTSGAGIAESLLYKRREFAHEKEIRLIYCGQDGRCADDLFPFTIEPNDLFDKLTFDPRMDPELRKAYRLAIEQKGYSGRVTNSTLYQPPRRLVFKFDF